MKARHGSFQLLICSLVLLFPLTRALGAPSAAAPSEPRHGAEPAEEQLGAVDPEWKAKGWHAVAPHAFVLKKLLAVRERPDAGAPIAFYLKGGVRVPVVEQGQEWWRISWTDGRTGWAPAADLEPHAAFVLLDAQTGQVRRRFAAKGQQGTLSDGKYLWSLSNTGLTRMDPAERPTIWSFSTPAVRESDLPSGAVWDPSHSLMYVQDASHAPDGTLRRAPLLQVEVKSGSVKTLAAPHAGQLLGEVPGRGLVFSEASGKKWKLRLVQTGEGKSATLSRQIDMEPIGLGKEGVLYAFGKGRLARYDLRSSWPGLKPSRTTPVPKSTVSGCLSGDGKYVAVGSVIEEPVDAGKADLMETGAVVRIYRVGTLQPAGKLVITDGSYSLQALAPAGGKAGGWNVVLRSRDDGSTNVLMRFAASGRRLKTWDSVAAWTLGPNGLDLYAALDESTPSVVHLTSDGNVRKFPISWRKPFPDWLHLGGGDNHWDTTSLTLTPDRKTIVFTEWLSGDPEG